MLKRKQSKIGTSIAERRKEVLARTGICPTTPLRTLAPVTDAVTGKKVWRPKASLSPEAIREIKSHGISPKKEVPTPQRVLQEKNELSPGSDAAGDGGEKKS